MRRQILRVLHRDGAPQTLRDLSTEFPQATLNQVSYHVLVLSDCGSVAVSSADFAGGASNRSFISAVAENSQVAAILEATEAMDAA
jgi:hypothetical protein